MTFRRHLLRILWPLTAILACGPAAAQTNPDDVYIRQRNAAGTAFVDRPLPADQTVDTWAKFREEAGILGADEQAVDVDPAGTAIAEALSGKLDRVSADSAITVVEGSPDTATLVWGDARWRTLSIDEATTLSYTAPAAGDVVTLQVTNAGAANYPLTVPSTYSESIGANRTTWTIPAGATATVSIRYDGTSYRSYGDPVPATKFVGTRASPDTTGGSVTISDSINGATIYANTATEYDLEAAANWAGKVVLVHNCGTNTITIDPAGSEVIYLASAPLSGGDRITISNTAGSFVSLQSDGTSIIVWGYSGTIADGN
jgi:hypothetical protein